MNYIQVNFRNHEVSSDIIIATIHDLGFEAYEELDSKEFNAYIPADAYNEDSLKQVMKDNNLTSEISSNEIESKNWNESWENDYEPIIIEGFCSIIAPFHKMEVKTPYKILIQPKMSFGTGHHETTQLMMEQIAGLSGDFKDLSVLDYGAGTGVLGITMAKLGARSLTLLDNNEWAFENMKENCIANDINTKDMNLSIIYGEIEQIPKNSQYDIILANITKNVIIDSLKQIHELLKPNGQLIISGFYEKDIEDINASINRYKLTLKNKKTLNSWASLHYKK